MFKHRVLCAFLLCYGFILFTSPVLAIGFQLSGTKESLNLKYDITVMEHGTGRVTLVLTITDQGKLKPFDSIDLVVPDEKKNQHGGRYADLSVALAAKEQDGKEVVRVHILRELAERAEIQFRTHQLDGKQEPLTWYYYALPVAELLKAAKDNPQ